MNYFGERYDEMEGYYDDMNPPQQNCEIHKAMGDVVTDNEILEAITSAAAAKNVILEERETVVIAKFIVEWPMCPDAFEDTLESVADYYLGILIKVRTEFQYHGA